jgi:hypothetical protein
MRSKIRKVSSSGLSSNVVSAVDQFGGSRLDRFESAKLGAVIGAGFSAVGSLPVVHFSLPEKYRVGASLLATMLGGVVGAFRGFRKGNKIVKANALAVARELTNYYFAAKKYFAPGPFDVEVPVFSSEKEKLSAFAFYYLISNYKYVYINRKLEIVGSNINPKKFNLPGYLRFETEKIRNHGYFGKSSKI